jgi:membrane-associated phospholipid phosphatase
MKKMIGCYRLIPQFWAGYLLFSIPVCIYCCTIDKGTGFLLINRMHTSMLDLFFESFTNIGNGIFIIGVALFYIFRKKTGLSFQIILGFIISGLVVQAVKHFAPSPRPKVFFGHDSRIHCINGITGTGYSSFPSGHTASIFSLVVLLSIYYCQKNPKTNACFYFLTIAVLTAYSRIYLSQHFPVDVLAGSIIGVCVSLAVFAYSPVSIFENNFSKVDFRSVKLR